MPSLTVTVPLPPAILQPNRAVREHYQKLGIAKKKYRRVCWAEALAAMSARRMSQPRTDRATVTVTAYFKTAAKRDADNILSSFKACFDGFTDAGVWSDDHGIVHNPVVIAKDAERPRAVVLIQWEVS